MKIKIFEEAKVICSNRTGLHNYFGWPSINRLPDGTLAMVTSGMRVRHICPFGKVVACYSRDDGKTWTKPMILIDTALDDRDAGIAVSGNRVMVTSFNNTISQQKAWNAETRQSQYYPSETRPTLYSKKELHACTKGYIEEYLNSVDAEEAEKDFLGSTYIISEDGGYTYGDIKRIPVTAPHGPAVGNDGKFVYVGTQFDTKSENVNSLACYIEGDDGEFHYTGSIEDLEPYEGQTLLSCEPHSLVLPDGKIIVHIRVQTAYDGTSDHTNIFTIYQSESTDGGKTFTKPHLIIDDMNCGAPAHLLRLKNGTIISSIGYRSEPYGIKVMSSKDDGETWSEPYMIYNNNSIALDIGYPASVELGDGSILTIFYARPEAGAPAEIMQVIWKIED